MALLSWFKNTRQKSTVKRFFRTAFDFLLSLLAFFRQYSITLILLWVISTLVYQSFFINRFPWILHEKQRIIQQASESNQRLKSKNQALTIELKVKSEADMEVLESLARYRFGLIKADERYYQISESHP